MLSDNQGQRVRYLLERLAPNMTDYQVCEFQTLGFVAERHAILGVSIFRIKNDIIIDKFTAQIDWEGKAQPNHEAYCELIKVPEKIASMREAYAKDGRGHDLDVIPQSGLSPDEFAKQLDDYTRWNVDCDTLVGHGLSMFAFPFYQRFCRLFNIPPLLCDKALTDTAVIHKAIAGDINPTSNQSFADYYADVQNTRSKVRWSLLPACQTWGIPNEMLTNADSVLEQNVRMIDRLLKVMLQTAERASV